MYGSVPETVSLARVCKQTLCRNNGLLSPQISTLIQDLQELHAHTPQEHVDYDTFQEIRDELNCIQKVPNTLYLFPFCIPSYALRLRNITVLALDAVYTQCE